MTLNHLIYSLAVLLLAGGIKGYSGVGLPMIAIPALALMYPIEQAIGLMVIPVLFANLVQARQLTISLLRNRWLPILTLSLILGMAVGYLLIPNESTYLTLMVGLSMSLFALLSLSGYRLSIPASARGVSAVAFGGIAGVIGGPTSLYGWPLVIFVSSTGLAPRQFIATISGLYLVGHLGFMTLSGLQGNLNTASFWHSLLACIPVFIGIRLGQRLLEHRGQSRQFYQLIYLLMLIGGTSLVARAL